MKCNTCISRWLSMALVLLAGNLLAANNEILRVATTTSTDNSGLLTVIQPAFEKALHIKAQFIVVGTGKALELGRRGDVDLVFVHAKEVEDEFVKAGYGLARHEVMYNNFIIVGPADDPAGIKGLHDAEQAFARISAAEQAFVSRGDDSGTDKKERAIWKRAGIKPRGAWYRQVGQGMGKTLQIADEMGAYTLVDNGTWLAYRKNMALGLLVSGGESMKNSYGLIAVNPARFPDVNSEAAQGVIDWFTTAESKQLITDYRVDGEQLFYPVGN